MNPKRDECAIGACTRQAPLVTCPQCEAVACRGCLLRYLLQDAAEDCWSCRVAYPRGFLEEHLPDSFHRRHEGRQIELRMNVEEARIGSTRAACEAYLARKRQRAQVQALQESNRDLLLQVRRNRAEMVRLSSQLPVAECESEETRRWIGAETKPCPVCGVRIDKEGGCDHMFCIWCKCSFSWTTLRVTQHSRGNPLYLAHVQAQRPDYPEDRCGGMPDARAVWAAVYRSATFVEDVAKELPCASPYSIAAPDPLRLLDLRPANLRDLVINACRLPVRLRRARAPAPRAPMQLRIAYMAGEISKRQWTRAVARGHRQQLFGLREAEAREALIISTSDTLGNFMVRFGTCHAGVDYVEAFTSLITELHHVRLSFFLLFFCTLVEQVREQYNGDTRALCKRFRRKHRELRSTFDI